MLEKAAVFTGIGSALGGIAGLCYGAPAEGANIGAAIGIQCLAAVGVEKIKEKVTDKTLEGVDSVGRKIGQIADETAKAVNQVAQEASFSLKKAGDAATEIILDIGHKWSTMALLGFVLRTALHNSEYSQEIYKKNCASIFESLYCTTQTMVTLSIQSICIASAIAMTIQAKKIIDKRKENDISKPTINTTPVSSSNINAAAVATT